MNVPSLPNYLFSLPDLWGYLRYSAVQFAAQIAQKIKNNTVAYQFIIEEIEAASAGDDNAKKFAKNSGITPAEYLGSMQNSTLDVEGPNGPQQLILFICAQLKNKPDMMVELRTKIVDTLMKKYTIGKYKDTSNHGNLDNNISLDDLCEKINNTGYVFMDILNDLGLSAEDIIQQSKLIQMTYAYARRAAVTALYIQGLVDEDGYDHNIAFFKSMQQKTAEIPFCEKQSVKFNDLAFHNAVKFMQTYSHLITKLLVKQMAIIASERQLPEYQIDDHSLMMLVMSMYAPKNP